MRGTGNCECRDGCVSLTCSAISTIGSLLEDLCESLKSADDPMESPRSKAKKRNASELSGDLQATAESVIEVARMVPTQQ
jgi:hypothetical protein